MELSILDSVILITAALVFPLIVFNSSNFGKILLTFEYKRAKSVIFKRFHFQKHWKSLFDVRPGFEFMSPDDNKTV